jgi:hypothetical protein
MIDELARTLSNSQLTLPAFELVLFMGLLSLSLLFRYSRTGIFVAYLFAFRWGWTVMGGLGEHACFWYLIFGCGVGVLSVLGFFADSKT